MVRRMLPLLLLMAAPATAQQPFTIEQILARPFPSDVVAATRSPTGRVGWVSSQRGMRSVWSADLTTGRATRVAHFPADDGQAISSLSFSRAGSVVAFVRGQGYNELRENPNPTSDPRGAEQNVWASVDGAPAKRIGRGWNPAVSPDGRRVVYQLDSLLMIAPSTGATPPRPLFKGRGLNTGAQWSPDNMQVAFTSQREDHAFVGVYDVARDQIRWLAPSVDRDGNARWSPDGKLLAFIRNAESYSFWLGDRRTGEARRLWAAESGSKWRRRTPTAGESFLWAGDYLVFFTEQDGWQHLYSLPTNAPAPQPVQLTTGECEVEEPSPTADGAWIYFSSNCGDIDRKHIWRVATKGGSAPEQITRGHTVDYAPAVSANRLFYLSGDAFVPPQPKLATLDGKPLTLAGAPVLPRNFPPRSALVEPAAVQFTAADGTPIRGQLFLPRQLNGRAPAIIFMHGGPSRQMLLGWHPRGYYNAAYGFNQYLASQGYVVLSVNYRGGVGYGRAFREAPNRGRSGASEYQDIVAGARYLQTLPTVDPERIGLWGGSYGGYLTAYGMAKDPALFKAGVDLHGVHDWTRRGGNVLGTSASNDSTAIKSSPICCVPNISGPLLLIHGDDDRNVNFTETIALVQLLRTHKKPFELIVFPDEVHDFLRHANWLTAYTAAAAFFDRILRGRTTATN